METGERHDGKKLKNEKKKENTRKNGRNYEAKKPDMTFSEPSLGFGCAERSQAAMGTLL